MGTSRSSPNVSPHLFNTIDIGDDRNTAAEQASSSVSVVPYLGIFDDETSTFGNLGRPVAAKHHNTDLDPPGRYSDVQCHTHEQLLLRGRDVHSSGRDLHSRGSGDTAESRIQKLLPGFDPPVKRAVRKHRRQASVRERSVPAQDDQHVRAYLRRLAARGASAETMSAYRSQLRATLRAASRLNGSSIASAHLFENPHLLGRALVDDNSANGLQLSKWTLAQRRSAIRSFANLMRPELLALLGEEPGSVVDRALRSVAERIGAGYRLNGGTPRRRGGYAPSRDEVAAVLQCLGRAPDVIGLRNSAFFGILAATGCRVNALRELEGTNCLVLPDGRVRIYLHEKGKNERREVELRSEAASDLRRYIDAFNRLAARRAWQARVQMGKQGAVWRNSVGHRWGYASLLKTLRDGCANAGVTPFEPHALRRAFASDAASVLPRPVVAQAGGWKGIDRLDDHYIQPRGTTVWEKLTRIGRGTSLAPSEAEMDDATVTVV